MVTWWKELDRLLRGESTRLSALRQGTIEVPAGGLSIVIMILGLIYGACMGSFALFKGGGPSYLQTLASMVKVPALIFLTLAVTFPSLYVFNALVGSRLRLRSALRLLIASLAVMQTVLASLGPITAFFSVSTTSYPFMVLLNVLVFGVSGFLGLVFLLRTLHRLTVAREGVPATVGSEGGERTGDVKSDPPGALDPMADQVLGRNEKMVFRCWVIVFGLVGAQMGWVLRPFIGSPTAPFQWFRPRSSNFFEAVWHTFWNLFG
jgi:hypothetical protein